MNKGGLVASGVWLQIDIARAGAELQVTARGSQGQEPAPHRLGAQLPPESLRQFAEWVKAAASRAGPLQPLSQAQALYEALFQQELRDVLGQLRGAAGGEPLLLRLNPSERDLHAVPWEALCRPGTTLDFLGISPELCLARGASSTRPWAPCRVEGPVRLLVISPEDEHAPERLRAVLHPSLEAGELEWLTPLTGERASKAYVLQRLRCKPVPHILHFIGHGGLDAEGHPTLRLADKEGEPSWLKVELLAKELEAPFRDTLRLVVLEACEGARPGTLSSAAALLAQAGAAAVVAHLWPVRADVARRCSVSFYRSLAGAEHSAGDVARSLHDARRTVLAEFDESAEAFSPVLYLRGPEPLLFDFQKRVPQPALPPPARLQSSKTEIGAKDALLSRFASLELWLSCPEPAAFSCDRLAQPLDESYGAKASLPSSQGSKLLLPLQLPREKLPRLIHDAESGGLDTLFDRAGARFVQEICEGDRCLFQHLPVVTFHSPPPLEDVGAADLKRLLSAVDVVLLTTTEIEREALYEVMKPFPGRSGLIEGAIQHNTYRLGRFGRYLAAHVESTLGSQARHGSTLTVHDAIRELSPKAVVVLGIAFGIDPMKQRLGDVIIAETVFPYELQRVGHQTTVHQGSPLPCGPILSERFRTRRTDWKLERGEDKVKVFQGPLLSGEKLTDNLAFRNALAEAFPTAWGGEMEGAGAYAATGRHAVEVLLVKAICDWADGSKSNRAQPFAAKAAVSLAHHVLSKRGVLEALHARDFESPEVPSSQPPPAAPPQHLEAKQAALQPLQDDPAVRSLLTLVRQPFSLLLGGPPVGNGAPGAHRREASPSLALIDALARRLPPGVHVTLQRSPLLEEALVRQQPALPLLVIQPSRPWERTALLRRYVTGQGWSAWEELPEVFDVKDSVLLLRLAPSAVPDPLIDRLPLAEEDLLVGTEGLESLLPPKLVDTLLSALYERPTLVLGVSLSVRNHPLALHHLFGHRPLPRKSTVLLEPGAAEAPAWQGGRGLPGGAGLHVVQAEAPALAMLLGRTEPERTS